MLLRCYLGPLNIVNFQNFARLGPDISKTGGRTKNFVCTQSLPKVVKNTLEPKKNTKKIFYYATQNFTLLPKNARHPRCLPRFILKLRYPFTHFKRESLCQKNCKWGSEPAPELYTVSCVFIHFSRFC